MTRHDLRSGRSRSPYRTAAQTSKYLWRPALLQHDVELALFLLCGQLLLLLVGKHVRLAPFVGQQEFLVLDHLAGRVDGPFEIVAVDDGVGRAGVHAEAAEDAPAVIDLVDLGVAMVLPDSLGVGARVFCAFDVDGVRRTGRRAQETRD